MEYDIVIVGGGIVGTATAYKLSLKYPDDKIALFDKEERLAYHQTGRNSGVIHSGIYYTPGSYKAKNCSIGRKQLVAFAETFKVKHDVCGKIILATKKEELPALEKIFKRGVENRIEGITKLNTDQIKDFEPLATGVAAIHVPCTGIIDFKDATQRMGELFLSKNQNEIHYNTEVIQVQNTAEEVVLRTNRREFRAKKVIYCGGLQADRLAKLEGITLDIKIVPFRGDYYELTKEASGKVKNLIYPVPNPEFPFLGVHLTRMTDGTIECGPNAVFSFAREGYTTTSFNVKDTIDALAFKGTRKMFVQHWKNGINEQRRAFSKKMF